MTLLAQALDWSARALGRSREPAATGEPGSRIVWLAAAVWFVATLTAILWVWGLDTHVLATPDEALNRLAAARLSEHGRPFLDLAYPDPEDLAHPRHWVTVGDKALPSYAPVAIYGYAALLRLGSVGFLLVAALPAAAAAAFAAGLAKLLPSERSWLSLPAPLLAFPAIYWLMRPWVNISVLLICVCWAFFFWSTWRRSQNLRPLSIAIFCVGAAAAVRPDYAAYLMLIALVLGLAAADASQWKRVLSWVLAAGAGAVLLNLLLNWLVTGKPLLAAYQIVAARDEGTGEGPGGPLGFLRQLLVPMTIPAPRKALGFLAKYWLLMGPIAGLALAQLAQIPLLRAQSKRVRALSLVALVVMLCFMLARMDPTLAGAKDSVGMVHHSMPRYWSPLFLLAVVPPLAYLGSCRRRPVFMGGALLLVVLAVASGYELLAGERFSLLALRDLQRESTQTVRRLERRVPKNAIVYSAAHDKILWSKWTVGTLTDVRKSARSLQRAVRSGRPVFVYAPTLQRRQYRKLQRALHRKHLKLVTARVHGLHRIRKERR
jgi:hypothetical protein